jgi:Raf kinase inhibitor-like YbhB/YbcL family protein
MIFWIFSNVLTDGGTLPKEQVFNQLGFDGENVSPQLAWEGTPNGTRSFVVTALDPDAPTGSGWWHWVVVDIPADVKELARGAGSGRSIANSHRLRFCRIWRRGAASSSTHRYVFTVFAIGTEKLGVDADASGAVVGFLTNMNVLDKASLTVTYGGR